MRRLLLSLERPSLDEREAKVCYQHGKEANETQRMDYLEFIAQVVSHIPDKGQVTVRYYGLSANALVFIDHLKLRFVVARPPPPYVVPQEFFLDSETPAEYFS
ncbi:MAG: transposase [Candidatus Aminicenantales bacterium]